ncbi:phosphopantetheine-binding protein [Streptacidiphilus sp. P02-A3a]|uniref:phosphopantetheine-binding protein n=1 Tax=Streptacidiphilus sp. P02-A3a TaxID=2704468 RepID=UPI0015FDAA61|nr:phosphopantetheine-binding protein [Streptacidiphilus sp. P02-A3a]QMU69784.1 acyl carrier protein [Streptacidiphilus sp. P02-A3a]
MTIDDAGTGPHPWDDRFEQVLRPHLPAAGPGQALHDADELRDLGLDSMETIQLLLDLESRFEVTFPDELLTAETFATVGGLWTAVSDLLDEVPAEGRP